MNKKDKLREYNEKLVLCTRRYLRNKLASMEFERKNPGKSPAHVLEADLRRAIGEEVDKALVGEKGGRFDSRSVFLRMSLRLVKDWLEMQNEQGDEGVEAAQIRQVVMEAINTGLEDAIRKDIIRRGPTINGEYLHLRTREELEAKILEHRKKIGLG